jgi:hypothetical protein
MSQRITLPTIRLNFAESFLRTECCKLHGEQIEIHYFVQRVMARCVATVIAE